MKDINKIIEEKGVDAISILQSKVLNIPSWSKLYKKYEPREHSIVTDNVNRKAKEREDGSVENPARIHVGLEKLLCKRINEFMFAIPVERKYEYTSVDQYDLSKDSKEANDKQTENNVETSEDKEEIYNKIQRSIEKIFKVARIDSENKKRGLYYFASCEFFTIWYTVKKPRHMIYGFPCEYKLKCKTYSPMDGYDEKSGTSLFPYFDELGDLLAMSFMYDKTVGDDIVTYFETYTDKYHIKWSSVGEEGWKEENREDISRFGKIPGVYCNRSRPIYDGLSNLRHEIEWTLSRNSDVVAYNSAPALVVEGDLIGSEDKGEPQRILRVTEGGSANYISWNQSIEAAKYDINTMLDLFWTQSQMPDISFGRMTSIGSIGYDARQTLLTDAHLKIGDESGPIIECLDRECNVVKAFLKQMNVEWASYIDNLDIENKITPYIQNDESGKVERLMKINGGKPLISHKTSVQLGGYVDDVNRELELIEQAQAADALARNNLFELG